MAGEAGFEPALQGSKPSGLPVTPFPIRAAPRCRPEPPALQERGRSRARRRSTLGAIRTHANQPLRLAPLPLGYEGVEPSSGADPDHLPYEGKVTAVRDGEAAGQGLEPRFTASEAAVLPLDDPALSTGGGSRNPHLGEV